MNIPVVCGRAAAEQETRLRGFRQFSGWRDLPFEEILHTLHDWPALVGTPEEVIAQIRAFEAAGVSEISLQWFAADDIKGLELLAAEVLPAVRSPS